MEYKIIDPGILMSDAFEKLEAMRRGVDGLGESISKHGIPPDQREKAQMLAAMMLAVMKSADALCRSLSDTGHILTTHLNPTKIDPSTLN